VIDVIDYRAGNAPSVAYALEHLGIPCRLARTAAEVAALERLILPGVGAADATLDSLAEGGLAAAIEASVRGDGVPFLGICIGLQVLFDHREEGEVDGLGWIPGAVRRFPPTDRVPQIGWNEVRFARSHPVIAALPDRGHFYFVNSYYADPRDSHDALGRTDYGVEFASVVAHDNVVATQFHAEKSGRLGLQILRSFSVWDGAPC